MARIELSMPRRRERPPLVRVLLRVAVAIGILILAAAVVYLDRDGYRDNDGTGLSFLDSLYYATVSLSTTGYGDIVPVTTDARIITIVLITPLRFLFLIVLVGTTIAVLTERGREQIRAAHWRSTVQDHTIICGFGTKGQAAARALIADGIDPRHIVAVDPRSEAISVAHALGIASIQGNSEQRGVLVKAEVERARSVLVTVHDDSSAVLITLTARQLNSTIDICTAVREEENVPLLRQSGARAVVTTQETAGRLIGLSACRPSVALLAQDLFSYGSGMDLVQRMATEDEVGQTVRDVHDVVLAVVRRGQPILADRVGPLQAGDELLYVRFAEEAV